MKKLSTFAGLTMTPTLSPNSPASGAVFVIWHTCLSVIFPLSNISADQDAIVAIMEAKGISTKETGFAYPDNYHVGAQCFPTHSHDYILPQVPDAKRQKTDASAVGVQSFPNTDAQYSAPVATSASTVQNAEEVKRNSNTHLVNLTI